MANTSKRPAAALDEIPSYRELTEHQTFTTLKNLIKHAQRVNYANDEEDTGNFSCLLTNIEEVSFVDQKTDATGYYYKMTLWDPARWGQEARVIDVEGDGVPDSGATVDYKPDDDSDKELFDHCERQLTGCFKVVSGGADLIAWLKNENLWQVPAFLAVSDDNKTKKIPLTFKPLSKEQVKAFNKRYGLNLKIMNRSNTTWSHLRDKDDTFEVIDTFAPNKRKRVAETPDSK